MKKGGHVDAVNSKSDTPRAYAEGGAKFFRTYKNISFPHVEDIKI